MNFDSFYALAQYEIEIDMPNFCSRLSFLPQSVPFSTASIPSGPSCVTHHLAHFSVPKHISNVPFVNRFRTIPTDKKSQLLALSGPLPVPRVELFVTRYGTADGIRESTLRSRLQARG